MNILNLVSTIPAFLAHAGLLEHEATNALRNPQLIAEINRNPIAKLHIDQILAEWRQVENDATSVKKSNILTAFPRASNFLNHANRLVADVTAETHDTALIAEIENMPMLKAEITLISAQWRAIQNDIGSLR